MDQDHSNAILAINPFPSEFRNKVSLLKSIAITKLGVFIMPT